MLSVVDKSRKDCHDSHEISLRAKKERKKTGKKKDMGNGTDRGMRRQQK